MRTATFNLSFPKKLLKKLDREAEREDRSRSELLRVAAQAYLQRKERWAELVGYTRAHARKLGITPADVEQAIREVRAR